MKLNPNELLGRFLHHRALARWKTAARNAVHADTSSLRIWRQQARQLRPLLHEVTHIGDNRLALPRIGSQTFPRPPGTDWSWRPRAWRGALSPRGITPAHNKAKLSDELTVFHDCPLNEVALIQHRNQRDDDLAAYGVGLEVFSFQGNFLSLVVDLPQDVCKGLEKRHLIRLSAVIDREKPIKILARLNVKHGPNTEQVLLTLPDEGPETEVEFDLAYSQLNEKRAERMWLDLMFESPWMNRINLRDLTLCRHPRAAL